MALFLKQEAELHGTYTVQQINIYPTGVQVSADDLTIYPYLASLMSIITSNYARTRFSQIINLLDRASLLLPEFLLQASV